MSTSPNPANINLHPIQLVEDDIALAQSTMMLLSTSGLSCVHYKSAEDFFFAIANNKQALSLPSCVISDIRLPKLSGLELLKKLSLEHPECVWPTILVTGHADVEMAVNAMHDGAFDFLTKPFDPFLLIQKTTQAIEKSHAIQKKKLFVTDYQDRYESLTDQEKRVCDLTLQNLSSREIAEIFGNSSRTVEAHRAAIFKKMGVTSVLDLAKNAERFKTLIA